MIGEIIISALTAFVISGGGALGAVGVVAGSSLAFSGRSLACAAVIGGIAAAKDVRSLMKLPPVPDAPAAKQ